LNGKQQSSEPDISHILAFPKALLQATLRDIEDHNYQENSNLETLENNRKILKARVSKVAESLLKASNLTSRLVFDVSPYFDYFDLLYYFALKAQPYLSTHYQVHIVHSIMKRRTGSRNEHALSLLKRGWTSLDYSSLHQCAFVLSRTAQPFHEFTCEHLF